MIFQSHGVLLFLRFGNDTPTPIPIGHDELNLFYSHFVQLVCFFV